MEISSEVISISKVRDGIFIGDMRAGINLDLLMQFKISHLINATGMQLPYSFESIGIKYLTIKWSENPPEDSKVITNEIVSRVISFVDDADMNGEGLLGFSFNGKNRICVLIILYLMSKFHWPLKKCYEYLKKKKEDMDINAFYRNQLSEYEKKLYNNNSIQLLQPSTYWNLDDLKDKDELLMRNTYKNEVESYKNENKTNIIDDIKPNIIRHVEWGDNKKYARQMVDPGLIHYNLDKDLFIKKNIKDITEHLHKKPLKSCIKHPNNSNTNTNSTGRRKKKTKIYLAADVNTINNSNKNSVSKTSPQEVNTDEIIITKRNNENKNKTKNNYHISDKIDIYDDNNLQIDKKQQNKCDEEDLKDEDNIDLAQNDEEDKNKKQNNNIINNLAIPSKNADANEKNKEVKYHTNIDLINKEIKENKKLLLNSNDIEFNIINMNSQKITTNDIKPILNNLLKIDPNLQTLKKYLKSTKKKTLINFSNTLSNIKINNINKINPQNSTNLNSIHSVHVNTNTNSISDSNNTPTIHTISNNNDVNANNINLIPIKLNNNLSNQNSNIKNKIKEEKKSNGLYLLNLNVNIDNRNTYNIKNNIINNPNNNNNGFNKKLNNFFMDANGNNYFNAFNKFRNRRANNSEQKDFLNNKLNYYLGKQNSHTSNEEGKKEDIIIPNIELNRNSHSTNNQRNNNKNDKIKMFIRPTINIDKNNINNMINKNIPINNISNPNSFIRKESKYIFFYN